MLDVASVIKNQVDSMFFANTFMGVIHRPGAFPVWGPDGVTQITRVDKSLDKFKLSLLLAVGIYNSDIKVSTMALQYVSSEVYPQVSFALSSVKVVENDHGGRVFTIFKDKPANDPNKINKPELFKEYDI